MKNGYQGCCCHRVLFPNFPVFPDVFPKERKNYESVPDVWPSVKIPDLEEIFSSFSSFLNTGKSRKMLFDSGPL